MPEQNYYFITIIINMDIQSKSSEKLLLECYVESMLELIADSQHAKTPIIVPKEIIDSMLFPCESFNQELKLWSQETNNEQIDKS